MAHKIALWLRPGLRDVCRMTWSLAGQDNPMGTPPLRRGSAKAEGPDFDWVKRSETNANLKLQ